MESLNLNVFKILFFSSDLIQKRKTKTNLNILEVLNILTINKNNFTCCIPKPDKCSDISF